MNPSQKIKVLFFCEAVTLAHVARPAVLSRSLDTSQYEVHMAQHPRYRDLLGPLEVTHHDLHSIAPEEFLGALAQGDPVYSEETLLRYVEEDRALIRSIRPDVIVGDFRISLQVSARLECVPFLTVSNAYWSEFVRQNYVVPDLPFTRLLGPRLGQGVFSMVRPLAFALHCRPMNAVRRRHGLPSIGTSLQRVYTTADHTLYADAPELFDLAPLPDNHHFLGPVVWSPEAAEPAWWNSVGTDRPGVYVTLGSSGASVVLPRLLKALGELPVYAMVSTAGAALPTEVPENVFTASYLHGEAAVARAQLVICNGGSPTTQQALVAGVPVIGLASNLDQHLNMSMIEQSGAGKSLRAASVTPQHLRDCIQSVLANADINRRAAEVAQVLSRHNAGTVFSNLLHDLLQNDPSAVTKGAALGGDVS